MTFAMNLLIWFYGFVFLSGITWIFSPKIDRHMFIFLMFASLMWPVSLFIVLMYLAGLVVLMPFIVVDWLLVKKNLDGKV